MSTTPPKPRRGRPATGRTPDKVRTAKSRAGLYEAGGKRLSVNLSPDGVADLEAIMERDDVDQTTAVHGALKKAARRR